MLPMFGEPYIVEIEEAEGGYDGGDPLLLRDIFGPPGEDKFNRTASYIGGAKSILTGVAGIISLQTGLPVRVDKLVEF